MKKLILLTPLLLSIFECSDYSTQSKDNVKQRVIGVQSVTYEGQSYQIVEIDGIEYVTAYGGGICPLIKK